MPKPMMMTIAVEEIAFGAVFRRIKNMDGVISLDIDAEKDERKYKGGGGIAKNGKGTDAAGTSALCVVLSALDAEGTRLTSGQLGDVLESAGKSRKTFANVSARLRNRKLAQKSKTGWALTLIGRKYLKTECRIA